MPSEPDNRMDDLLKAYAKKRRHDAGTPPELHPATRRLLQAESAKLRPKAPEQKGSWFSALLMFWPRYALAATVFVVLGVGAWSLFRFEEQPKRIALFDAEDAPRPEPARASESADMSTGPATASTMKKESEVRQLRPLADEKRAPAQRPASGPRPAEPQVALRDESSVRLKTVTDEAKTKQKLAELAANESPQKALKPTRLAVSPSADAQVPPPVTIPALPPDKNLSRNLAVAGAKDKGATITSDPALAGGKAVAFNDAQRQPLAGAENAPGYLNQGAVLSYSTAARPPLDGLGAKNPEALQLGNSLGAYDNATAPLANSRAQELFGLTNNSLGGRFGESPASALNGTQIAYDNYSKLPQLQAGSAGVNAQNVQLSRGAEADALARQTALAPPAQPPQTASVVSRNAANGTVPALPQTPAPANAERFYSRLGAVAQTSQSTVQSRNRFSQVQSAGQATPARRASGAAATVLAEFDFEQTGNRVRVVDADGSVYDGQIVEETVKADLDDRSNERARRDATRNIELRKTAPRQTASAESSAWNFRASGTNRTLQQPVTIHGVLHIDSTNFAGQQAQSTRGIQRTQQPLDANLPPVQRIQGRVQVGAGAETQLDAVRRGNN